jgi:hypothetical protein
MASCPLIRYLCSLSKEGFGSNISPGESIDFKVSMDPTCRFLIDIYCIEYHGSPGGRPFGVYPDVQKINSDIIYRMIKDSPG